MTREVAGKAGRGYFLEDFAVGQILSHAVPRTVTRGDLAVYNCIYGDRHPLYTSDPFARSCGLNASPVHDLLVFHIVFGKTVGDLSLNAIANLGYAEARFLKPVNYGDTLHAHSKVIGIKENSNGRTGIIWVETTGLDQSETPVLTYKRWVMIRKRNEKEPPCETVVPATLPAVPAEDLPVPRGLDFRVFDTGATGETYRVGDYTVGEMIDHVDCTTLTDTEHMLATRIYHNTARVHFDINARPDRQRLIYGGHMISLARAFTCNGLANAQIILAINSGTHVNPAFAGETVTARTEVIDHADHPTPGAGALRLRTRLGRTGDDGIDPYDDANLLLDLDYWCLMPR